MSFWPFGSELRAVELLVQNPRTPYPNPLPKGEGRLLRYHFCRCFCHHSISTLLSTSLLGPLTLVANSCSVCSICSCPFATIASTPSISGKGISFGQPTGKSPLVPSTFTEPMPIGSFQGIP